MGHFTVGGAGGGGGGDTGIFALLAGRSGGQTLIGGTGSGDDLTLSSTSNATKGNIFFGSSTGLNYDEANAQLGVGGAGLYGGRITARGSASAFIGLGLWTSSLTGYAALQLGAGDGGADLFEMRSYHANGVGTVDGEDAGDLNIIRTVGGRLVMSAVGANEAGVNTNGVRRTTWDSAGNVTIGASAPATTATDGFPYIPAVAGAPTGTPTAKTGYVAMCFDTTGNQLNVYDGGWLAVTLV